MNTTVPPIEPNSVNECDELRDLLPAYMIGATDADETALVESLLERCTDYADEIAAEARDYAAIGYEIALSAPPVQPSAALHDRIMSAARQANQTKPQAVAHATERRKLPVAWIGLASAAAALLIISNIFWINRVNTVERRMSEAVELLRGQYDILSALVGEQENVERVELTSTTQTDQSVVTVLWNPNWHTVMLFTDQLPALPTDRAYQLWLVSGEERLSAGVFQINERGQGVLLFDAPRPINTFDALGITEEPAGGSPAPTGNPVAAAQV